MMSVPALKLSPAGPQTVNFPDTALVCEGGGIRGFFTGGVCDGFLKADVRFPYVIGVSAGAANASAYVTRQYGRMRAIAQHHVQKPEYLSIRNFIFHGSAFGYDYVFRTIPERYVPFDWDAMLKNPAEFVLGMMSARTGETVWVKKTALHRDFSEFIATCSIPVLSRLVTIDGQKFLDGGVSTPIPIEKAMADGYKKFVIILTQNAGYRKPPISKLTNAFLKFYYRKFPQVAEVIQQRNQYYNRLVELCERLQREGKARIIRPIEKLRVGRLTKNVDKILDLYNQGEMIGSTIFSR